MKKRYMMQLWLLLLIVVVLAGCAITSKKEPNEVSSSATASQTLIDQPPVDPVITRDGDGVYIEMTSQVTNIEISEGEIFNAWTFNGTVPGPVLTVKQGDTIHFTLKNLDPNVPHSMDFHAVHAAPSEKFLDVMPDEEGSFVYPANSPGVFMYHCGTAPMILHVANGMYGVIIVEPELGYPTDDEIDREYTIVQSEWYPYEDYEALENGEPHYVVFNGSAQALTNNPLEAKAGEKIRLYVANAGPNEVSSFHVVGTIMDTVYLDGNPSNVLKGMQTVMLPAGGGAIVEFTVTEAGEYSFLTHQLNHAAKGAIGKIRVTE